MSDQSAFLSTVKAGYNFKSESVKIGIGMLDEVAEVDQVTAVGLDRVRRRAALELQAGKEIRELPVVHPHRRGDSPPGRGLLPAVLRLLARGTPVSPEEIAEATGATPENVRARLRSQSDVEIDESGKVVERRSHSESKEHKK